MAVASLTSTFRLRTDKVVGRVTARLRTMLHDVVPPKMTVLMTVTAPIRVPGKTADDIGDKVRSQLLRGASSRDRTATIRGNRVRIRVLERRSARGPRVRVFVHNPDVNARGVLDAASADLARRAEPGC